MFTVFLPQNVRETITVPKTWCDKGTCRLSFISVWILFRRKMFHFNDLIAFWIFLQLKFYYSKILTSKINRYRHSCKKGSDNVFFYVEYTEVWLSFRMNLLFFKWFYSQSNVFSLRFWVFLIFFFEKLKEIVTVQKT